MIERTLQRQNSHLTFKANTGVGRHGWLRLTPAYGVRLVRERLSQLPAGAVVTDPFSGTGTTPLGAAECGLVGQSIDINPFLVWLGRAKTRRYSPAVLAEAEEQLAAVVVLATQTMGQPDLWQPNLFKIEKWWSVTTLGALTALRHALDTVVAHGADREAVDLLEIGLCRTLIACSNASFNHQSMSFKPVAPEAAEPQLPIIALFEAEARSIIASASLDLPGSAVIVHGDSRDSAAADLVPCDLLLTSPPYVNRMSYIRELRPYMYWLRFLDLASDAGDLDWRAIGGTWGTATSRLAAWQPRVETPVDSLLAPVCAAITAASEQSGALLANYVHKYFHDMWLHFQSLETLVKPGGAVSYIVGNSTFYGNVVPAQDWLAQMLRALGYADVQVGVIRKRNSNKALFEYDVRGVRS